MSNTLERTHETIDFEPGSTVTIDLPRSHFYERLNLLADYDVTVSTAGSQKNAGILDLIEDISVTFDGSQTIKSTSLAMSHYVDWYQYQTRPEFDAVDWGTAADYTGNLQTFVDFLSYPGQYGGMLPSFQFSDLTLSVKWSTIDQITDADATINDASIEVQSRERKRRSVPTKKRPMDKILDSLHGFKEVERRRSIDVSGTTTVELPRGNAYYAVPIQVFDGGSPSNDLVEQVTIEENGVSTHKDSSFSLLRAEDKNQYGIEDRPDGFTYLNYGLHGDLSDIVPTANMDDFALQLDTDGTAPTDPAEVRVVTQEIVE